MTRAVSQGTFSDKAVFGSQAQDYVFHVFDPLDINGSVTPVNFDYVVPVGFRAKVERLNLYILDNGITINEFGGLPALSNGLLFQVLDTDGTTVLQHFGTDVRPVQRNAGFALLAGSDNVVTSAAGDDAVVVRWTVSKAGAPLWLLPEQRFRIVVQDNLTNITEFYACLQGLIAVYQ